MGVMGVFVVEKDAIHLQLEAGGPIDHRREAGGAAVVVWQALETETKVRIKKKKKILVDY